MTTLILLIIASLAIMLVSLSGVFFAQRHLKDWIEKHLKYLVSFSAGVFLIVSFNIAEEALEISTTRTAGIIAIAIGIVLIWAINRIVPEGHHHHDTEIEETPHTKTGARSILIGDALHNFGDGILLAPAFIISTELGIITTVGVLIHELVQEISEYFVLREAGYSTKEVLLLNFLVSTTVLVGALVGFFIGSAPALAGPLVGIAAGGFLYAVFQDLIPRSINYGKQESKYVRYFLAALLGVVLILALNQANPDAHNHDLEEQHAHEDDHGHDH